MLLRLQPTNIISMKWRRKNLWLPSLMLKSWCVVHLTTAVQTASYELDRRANLVSAYQPSAATSGSASKLDLAEPHEHSLKQTNSPHRAWHLSASSVSAL